jgi:hypothetical protein
MKTKLFKQGTINLALVALVSLLGACATASPQAENRNLTAPQRSNTDATETQGYGGVGNNVTVREIHGLPPIGL